MPLNLIGLEKSSCTMRVLIALAEKGVTDYKLTPLDYKGGEHKKSSYIAKQPFGAFPLLEDDRLTLFESRAIARYVAAKYAGQGTKLLPDPKDLNACALFEQWISVETAGFDYYASMLVGLTYYGRMNGQEPDQKTVDDLTTKLTAKMDVLDGILAKQHFMGGNEFSLVDIFYIPATARFFDANIGHLVDDRPNVKAWWERVSTRESWKKLSKVYAF